MCNFSITEPMIRDTVKRASREKTVPPWIETLTFCFPFLALTFTFTSIVLVPGSATCPRRQ